MSIPRDRKFGGTLILLAVVWATLSNWGTVISLFPPALRPYVEAPATAIILAAAGAYFLWRAANAAEEMQQLAAEALRIANESNVEMTQRIEASNAALKQRVESLDAKLTQVLNEKIMDWAPAFQKLHDDFTNDVENQKRSIESQFRQTLLAVARLSGAPVGGINTAIPSGGSPGANDPRE